MKWINPNNPTYQIKKVKESPELPFYQPESDKLWNSKNFVFAGALVIEHKFDLTNFKMFLLKKSYNLKAKKFICMNW